MSGSALGIVDTDVGPLIAPMDEWIWPCLRSTGQWEPLVGEAVREVLRAGDVAVNVGAHVGYFTRMASIAVCGTGWVYAYEPAPSNRRLLELNTSDRANVVIRDSAVSDAAGWATFSFSNRNTGDHRVTDDHPDGEGSMSVQVVCIDDQFRHLDKRIRLLFVDAQGLDLKVLRGAREVIERDRPHVMIEWTPRELDHADYPALDAILDLGYESSAIEDRRLRFKRAVDGDVIGQGTCTLHLAPL